MTLSAISLTGAALMALSLCYAGMAGLCLAMDRHHGQVWARDAPPAARWGLRAVGTLLLALALCPCLVAWGATVGVVVWLGFLSAGALLLVGLLSYVPRLATVVAALAALAGLATLLVAMV